MPTNLTATDARSTTTTTTTPATHGAPSNAARTLFDDDIAFFRALRTVVAPHLRTWAHVNVWVAGASTGEQAYAIAIALREEGLAGRLQVHATDADEHALSIARGATYDASTLLRATDRYRAGGGRASLVDYVAVRGDRCEVRDDVRRDVGFALHSPATDGSFTEAQLVVCRGAFERLRGDGLAHAWHVVHESLCRFGVLAVRTDDGPAGARAGNRYAGRYEAMLNDAALAPTTSSSSQSAAAPAPVLDDNAGFFRRGDA